MQCALDADKGDFAIMFGFTYILMVVCLGNLDSTRVSRIKPAYLNHGPEGGNERYLSTNEAEKSSNPTLELVSSAPLAETPLTLLPPVRPRVCDKPYSCVNCTTYRLCAPSAHGLIELHSGTCPADRPYCDDYSGTCVNSVATAVQCASPDHSFRCMRNGYFPHPSDSSKYYICFSLKAYGYSCRQGYKYYAPSQSCTKVPWIANPFDCSDLNATKVLYSNGGSFFAYCVNGQPYLVSSCSENEFFNVSSQVCEPQCSQELIAPDTNNCAKYFKCFKNATTLSYEKISYECPSGEGFSSILKRCVPLNHLPGCVRKRFNE